MNGPLVTLIHNGQPVLAGATVLAVPGRIVSMRVRPDGGGWPVLADAPRTPFLTLLLEGAGLTLDGASLDGQALQTFAVRFDASGHAAHPLTHGSEMVAGPPGGTLVAVRLPYGLTLPGARPDIEVQLSVASDAAPGTSLRVSVAVPDSTHAIAATSFITLSPVAVMLDTTVDAPEQETVTGAIQEVTVHAAAAVGVTGLVLQATLPPGAAFAGAALLGGTGTTSFDAQTGIVTGLFTQPGNDARMVVRFYALGPGLLEGTTRGAAVMPGQAAVFPPDGPGWALAAKPVALRSGVSAVDVPAPGRQLQWTLTGSVSPAGANDLRITDTLGNGQHFDPAFAPRLTVSRGGMPVFSGSITPTITTHADGTSTLGFDISDTATGVWSLAGSTIEVVFRSTVNQLFEGRQAAQLVGQGDRLDNAAVLHATVRGAAVSDMTTASLTLPASSLQFSVYAVNGQIVHGPVHAAIGDAITYRVQATLPLTTARGFIVLAVGPGPLGAMVFDGVTSGIPRAGHAQFGPDGSYTANAPAMHAAADGTVRFDFGYVLPVYGNGSATLDLLYTARLDSTASDPGVPEAQAWLQERNTEGVVHQGYAAATLALELPVLRLQTASLYASNAAATWTGTGGPAGYSPFTGQFGDVITSAGLAAEPFRDVLFNVDAGDEVTFVIAIESLSAGPAFGVVLHNSLPPGFTIPAGGADVVAMDGDGNLLGSSGNLFDPAIGLMLDAPIPHYNAQSGLNVVLITFTLHTQQAMSVPSRTESVARLLAYRAEPGAANLVATQPAGAVATTGIVTVQPAVSIALAATSATRTTGSVLALGETATFAVTITLPEGQVGALTLDHLLPDELEFISADIRQLGGSLSVPAGVSRNGQGLSFGIVTNTADDQVTDADRIQVQLVARVRSVPSGPVRVAAVLGAANPDGPVRWSGSDYTDLSVIAPSLLLQANAPVAAQAGEVATFTLRLLNAPGTETAFNVRLTGMLAPGLALVSGSMSASGTASAATVAEAGGTVTATLARLEPGEALLITFQARVGDGAVTGGVLSSTATATADALGATSLVADAVQAGADAVIRIVAPAVSVAMVGQSSLAAGGVATYRITATAPEGISPAVVLRSVLPAGLVYVPGSARVVGVGAALPGLAAPGLQVDQQHVRLDFGQVNAGTGDRSIIVELQASVSGAAPLGPSLASVLLQTGYTSASGNVTATVVNTPPALSLLSAGQATPDDTALPLFAGLVLTDPNDGQTQTILITLSDPANGSLTGAVPDTPGTYRITGTTVAANAALAGVRFVPAPHRAAFGQTVRTTITLDIQDSAGGRVSAATTVAAVTTNTAPTIGDAVAGQSVPARVAALPFATLTLGDRDAGQVSVLTVRMSDPAHGQFVPSAGSLDTTGAFHMTGLLPDLQAAARALAYVPAASASNATVQFTITLDDGAGGVVSSLATTVRVAPSVDTGGVAQHFGLSPDADFTTFGGGQQTVVRGEVYGGPVTYLRSQLIYDSSEPVVIVARTPDVFVKSFSGFAAIQVSSGRNVVDAGPGSNFIVGGSGDDTFFLDGNLGQVVWNTISGFTPGDAVTIFGWRPGVSSYVWENEAGATGYTGRTLRADLRGEGQTSGSLTFVGSVKADTDRYSISEGQVAGFNYLSISNVR